MITVTLNPSFDVTLWTDGLDGEAANRVVKETREAGGKGIQVSRVLRSLGLDNLCLAVTGEDNSQEFAACLQAEGLRYQLLQVSGIIRENLTLRYQDQTIKINRKGPYVSAMILEALMALIQCRMQPGDLVVFSGSLPEISVRDFVELLSAVQQAGARLVIDTDVLTLDHYAGLSPWLVKPNLHELRLIVDVKSDSFTDIWAAAERLHRAGVENVLVSLGGRGMVFVGSQFSTQASVPQVPVKSTVGAGDSALAGFLFGVENGFSLPDALRLAAACGTACVMREGSAVADRETAFQLMDSIQVTPLSRPADQMVVSARQGEVLPCE